MKTTHVYFCFLVLTLAACLDALAQPWPAELRIQRQPTGPVRLELFGDLGNDYSIEAADNPGASNWSPLVTLSLTGTSQTWLDSGWCGRPRRFYRAVSFNGQAPLEPASSFRLIDHLGKSRELSYHWNDTNVAAFVLLFTANGCASVRHFAPALAELRNRFEPQKIRFWLVDSSSDSRSNLVADASLLGLGLPILHDRAQVVARAYHATTAPEVIGVSRGEFGWGVFYRGPSMTERTRTRSPAHKTIWQTR